MDSLSGKLLIATPSLADTNFFRSVVLLLHHSKEGASGVILNQPTSTAVSAVWDEISEAECDCDYPVNCGGPVEGPLIALHQMPSISEQEVTRDVYLSLQRDSLHQLVMQSERRFRIYSGYSGWGSMQLDSEIENGSWLTLDASACHVFGESDELWRHVCEHVGHDVLKHHLGNVRQTDPTLS